MTTLEKAKVLVDFVVRPGREDGGWGMSIPVIATFKGVKDMAGQNVKVENNSKRAVRIVVYDYTKEWEEQQRIDREAVERQQLKALKKKYER